jgi:hypothetical protein
VTKQLGTAECIFSRTRLYTYAFLSALEANEEYCTYKRKFCRSWAKLAALNDIVITLSVYKTTAF